MILSRRGFLTGLGAAFAAPAIVKYANIMPVRNRLWTPTDWPYMTVGEYLDTVTMMQLMRENNIPPMPDGRYALVVPPALRDLAKQEYPGVDVYDQVLLPT